MHAGSHFRLSENGPTRFVIKSNDVIKVRREESFYVILGNVNYVIRLESACQGSFTKHYQTLCIILRHLVFKAVVLYYPTSSGSHGSD